MGIDLTLCPEKYQSSTWFLAYDRLSLMSDYRVFDQLEGFEYYEKTSGLRAHPLPPNAGFDWYGDEGIEQLTEDAYGTPLTFMYAKDLSTLDIPDDTSDWNKAVFAFVKALDPDTRIVLWWH